MDKEFAISLESDDIQLVTRGNRSNITMWIDRQQMNGIVDSNLFAVIERLHERGFVVEMKKGQADNDCPT